MEDLDHFPLDWGVRTFTLPGQSESGDLHVVKTSAAKAMVGVVDGLGHGDAAAAAAKVAVRALLEYADEPIISLLNRCHENLRATRGAVMNVAFLNSRENTLTWLGVGNVQGVLYRAGGLEPMASLLAISPGDTLIFSTDGVHSDFALSADLALSLSASPQSIADRIIARHVKGTDDALALVARYRRATS
ncbi:MAG: stage II sporulation protein E (SpoIIE) [Acidobacteria bacterium]|nr:MAG: stage II sporulation protein E (SpoIIE) [Acidobacteriota bacterium]